jgi:hypothetical protein
MALTGAVIARGTTKDWPIESFFLRPVRSENSGPVKRQQRRGGMLNYLAVLAEGVALLTSTVA